MASHMGTAQPLGTTQLFAAGPDGMALDGGAPSPAASTAAPSDLLNLDNSPQKRGRVEQPQVTMDALRDLFRGELQIAVGQLNEKVGKLEVAMQAQRAEVTDQIGEVKEECRGQREHLSAVSTKDAHRQARAKWHQRGTGKGTSPDNRRMAPGLRGDQGHRAGQQVRCRAKVGHFYMRDTSCQDSDGGTQSCLYTAKRARRSPNNAKECSTASNMYAMRT